jgi:hypothetical protein
VCPNSQASNSEKKNSQPPNDNEIIDQLHTIADPPSRSRRCGVHCARRCPVPRPPSLPASHSQAPNSKARRPAGHLIFSKGRRNATMTRLVPMTDLPKNVRSPPCALDQIAPSGHADVVLSTYRAACASANGDTAVLTTPRGRRRAVRNPDLQNRGVKCYCRRCTSAHIVPSSPQSGQILVCFASAALPVLLIGNVFFLMPSAKSEL